MAEAQRSGSTNSSSPKRSFLPLPEKIGPFEANQYGVVEVRPFHFRLVWHYQCIMSCTNFSMTLPNTIGSRLFQRLRVQGQPQASDIDKYFDSPLEYTSIADNDDPIWLCKWYPQMAALTIPASGVAVERLFNRGQDQTLSISQDTRKIEINGIVIKFTNADVKWPTGIVNYSNRVSELFRDWEESAMIHLKGVPVPLKYWGQLFSRVKPSSWKTFRKDYSDFKVGLLKKYIFVLLLTNSFRLSRQYFWRIRMRTLSGETSPSLIFLARCTGNTTRIA